MMKKLLAALVALVAVGTMTLGVVACQGKQPNGCYVSLDRQRPGESTYAWALRWQEFFDRAIRSGMDGGFTSHGSTLWATENGRLRWMVDARVFPLSGPIGQYNVIDTFRSTNANPYDCWWMSGRA